MVPAPLSRSAAKSIHSSILGVSLCQQNATKRVAFEAFLDSLVNCAEAAFATTGLSAAEKVSAMLEVMQYSKGAELVGGANGWAGQARKLVLSQHAKNLADNNATLLMTTADGWIGRKDESAVSNANSSFAVERALESMAGRITGVGGAAAAALKNTVERVNAAVMKEQPITGRPRINESSQGLQRNVMSMYGWNRAKEKKIEMLRREKREKEVRFFLFYVRLFMLLTLCAFFFFSGAGASTEPKADGEDEEDCCSAESRRDSRQARLLFLLAFFLRSVAWNCFGVFPATKE